MRKVPEDSSEIFAETAKLRDRRQVAEKIVADEGRRELELRQVPVTGRDAVKMVAATALPDKMMAVDPNQLTDQQSMAALLIGQGLTYAETSTALGVGIGEMYAWAENLPGFKNKMYAYRERVEEELGGTMLVKLQELMAKDLDPDLQIKALSLVEKISKRPEDRAFRRAELSMKAESLKIQRQGLAAKAGQAVAENSAVTAILSKFGERFLQSGFEADKEALDAEFEVEEVQED